MTPQHILKTDSFERHHVIHWRIPESVTASAEVHYRNAFAMALAERSPAEIVKSYVYLSVEDMDQLLQMAMGTVEHCHLAGIGIELGAGCGLLSSLLAKKPQVQRVYAVEICEQMAQMVIPKVAASILGDSSNKVIPVWGSFDDIDLPDASVDFIAEIDSFHHSHDLQRTFAESARVLRPGGLLLCLDRCHPDSVTDAEVEEMLSAVYSQDFLITNNYPPNLTLTRRQNGEHEYRNHEWHSGFEAAGLELVARRQLRRRVSYRRGIKGLLRVLPAPIRRRLYAKDDTDFASGLHWLAQHLGLSHVAIRTNFLPLIAPKNTTVFVLRKPQATVS